MRPSSLHDTAMDTPGLPLLAAWPRPGYAVDADGPVARSIPTPWTSFGGDGGGGGDLFADGGERWAPAQQSLFLHEYNRLAKKHGLRPLQFEDDVGEEADGLAQTEQDSQAGDRRGWFSRTFGKPPVAPPPPPGRPSRLSVGSRSDKSAKHKRSDSDPASQALPPPSLPLPPPNAARSDASDTLRHQTLQTLVRVCGKSFLYLPGEYATRSLVLPTCFRAAAQYLVQHGPETRGIFRISGSVRVVNELYDYYCVSLGDDEDIAATVRSPNLPFHIKAGVHDVASMFKRLLAGLPGGILGHIRLFQSLAEIHKATGQAGSGGLGTLAAATAAENGHANTHLIALAIGSVPSPFQRELICAVFGLLSLIGYAAETAPPGPSTPGGALPHSEKMGYAALGIVFGPLLVGDLIDAYVPESAADACAGSSAAASPTLPSTPSPRSKTDKRRKSMASDKQSLSALPSTLDNILLANGVAEMLITRWRDIVVQMKALGIMRRESLLHHHQQQQQPLPQQQPPRPLRPSRSETFTGQNTGAVAQYAPHLHSAHLRKTRSASITRSPPNSTRDANPLPGANASQRPADMTFEEFAARKRLRNYASTVSMASDSSHAATELLPAKTRAHAVDDPFFAPSSAPTETAKVARPRRLSAGFSAMFGDKAASPTKGSPRRLKRNTPRAQEGGQPVPPWTVSLSPATATGTTIQPIQSDAKTLGSPAKTTPGRAYQGKKPGPSLRSEPAGRASIDGTPQSKTAAIIAKIMNTRHQTASAGDSPSHKDKARNVSDEADKAPNAKPIHGAEHASPAQRPDNGGASTPRSGGKWPRRNAAQLAGAENQPVALSANTPATPRRRWKAHGVSAATDGRASPKPSVHASQQPSTPHKAGSAETAQTQSRAGRHRVQDSRAATPQRRLAGGHGQVGARSEGKLHSISADPASVVGGNNSSPLSEIKNDARGLNRGLSESSSTGTLSKAASAMARDGHVASEPTSPGTKSTVKAMAAMFDSAAWKTSVESPGTAATAPTVRARGMPNASPTGRVSQYRSNTPPARAGEHASPTRVSDHSALQASISIGRAETPAASLQALTHERRRLRLSKSEDRSARLVRGRLAANERHDLSRSTDRKDAAADGIRRKPLGADKSGGGRDRPAQTRGTIKKWGGAEVHPAPAGGGHGVCLVERSASTSSQTVEYATVLSPPPKTTAVAAPLRNSLKPAKPGQDLQDLQQRLNRKTVECESWKARAEAAETKLARLELLLSNSSSLSGAGSHGRTSLTRHSCSSLGEEDKHEAPAPESGQSRDRGSWAWQDLVPAAATPPRTTTRAAREAGGSRPTAGAGLGHAAARLARCSVADDGSVSEASTTTVVVRGRLLNDRLQPFSLYDGRP